MTHFWKWLAASLACAALGYGLMVVVSGLILPWRPAHFDTHSVTTSQPGWGNEARYFVLNQHLFAGHRNRIVILGASNMRDPFRPALMERRLPSWSVANASLSGAGIGELGDAVDLYYLEKGSGTEGRTVFVLGLNYIQFLPSPYVNGVENPLATEAMRGGLRGREDGRLVARLPRGLEDGAETLYRPQAIVASLPRRAFSLVFVNPHLPLLKDAVDRFRPDDPLAQWTEFIGEQGDLNTVTVPEAFRPALTAQRLAAAGGDRPLSADGFEQLSRIIARIRANGDEVVIVELPLPRWHAEGARVTEASFSAGLTGVLQRSQGDPGVARVSLREFDADENFFDSAHPKPRLWPVFSARLAELLATSPAVMTDAPAARDQASAR